MRVAGVTVDRSLNRATITTFAASCLSERVQAPWPNPGKGLSRHFSGLVILFKTFMARLSILANCEIMTFGEGRSAPQACAIYGTLSIGAAATFEGITQRNEEGLQRPFID
ncbi:hypothetical protein [Paraburkholderia sp. JHI869]|uniref:hypothetical protein n=1 Tax=Paraburkholderia sp. JHI869 TaxID=3112959 RepID=UPI00317CE60E